MQNFRIEYHDFDFTILFYELFLLPICNRTQKALAEGFSSIAFLVRDRTDITDDPEQLKRERKKA